MFTVNNMIYVVDLIRRGDEHRTTNHPSLQVLAENKLIKHLWISYDSTSFNDLELKQDFSTTHIRVSSDKKYRWITSTLLTIAILLKSKKNSTDVIFLYPFFQGIQKINLSFLFMSMGNYLI
jgi:hypothetical protein